MTALTRGNPVAIDNQKVSDMADAMTIALERARLPVDSDPDPYGYLQELEIETGVELLEPRWKAQPNDNRWVARIKGRARKAIVARLFSLGFAVPQIAVKVNVSESTVYNDLENVAREWRKSYIADTEALAGRDLATLDYLLQKLAEGIDRGDTKAILAAVEIIKQRGDILGYRQGLQVDITQYIREAAEAAGFNPDKAEAIASRISVTMR